MQALLSVNELLTRGFKLRGRGGLCEQEEGKEVAGQGRARGMLLKVASA